MAKVLWTQKQDIGPSARGEHTITYDSARQRVVLFGGRAAGGTPQGDTWEWDGEDWTQVADTGPDARSEHALAFDPNRQRAVLFGGEAAESALRGDTWEWDGEFWTQVADTGPDPRRGHALAFDTNRQRAVLFGGEAESALRGDTWEWDGEDWTEVADTGPDARSGHALAFDPNRQRAVLFGGEAAESALRGDTWEWDGAHWTQEADTGPGLSLASAMTFAGDASAGTMVGGATLLFGGVTSSPAHVAVEAISPPPDAIQELSRLSWEWDGEQWTLRQDMGPAPRWGHALALDSARGKAVLFGGFSALPADPEVADSVLADTWEAALEEIPVDVPGPALLSFAFTPETVEYLGGGMGVAFDGTVVFEVRLDGPAPPGGVQVDIFLVGAQLMVLPGLPKPEYAESLVKSVVVAEGEATSSQTLRVAGRWHGDFEYEARLDTVTKPAVLHVR